MKIKFIRPDYYDDFVCIADKCHNNCCEGGWIVEISEDTVEAYKKTDKETGSRIMDTVCRDEDGDWCFKLEGGKCPHLDEKGLCTIYQKYGEKYMGVVCREFPRHTIYYGNTKEMGIGLGCEEAVRIILEKKTAFSLKESIEDISENDTDFENEAEDEVFSEIISEARNKIFEMLYDETYTFEDRIKNILEYGENLQEAVNEEDYDAMKAALSYKPSVLCKKKEYDSTEIREVSEALTDVYSSLEILNTQWSDIMAEIADNGLSCGQSVFDNIENGENIPQQLMSYFIFRYFMRAVYDYNVSDKIRLCVSDFLILRSLMEVCLKKENRKLAVQDLTQMISMYSREVEYSDDNVEAVCEELNFGDTFSAKSLAMLI